MVLEYFTNSSSQTKKLGEILAKKILKQKTKKRIQVLGLQGDLGGGKTTFSQGFARGLRIKERVLSPTFVIFKKFKIPGPRERGLSNNIGQRASSFRYFYHIDCYRIQKPKEILDLGFKRVISAPQNIVVIEWADRILKILPRNIILITFEFNNKNKRKITVKWPKKNA